MKTSLRAQLLLATGLIALIVGGAFALLLFAIGDLRSSANLARHSEEVLASANALEKTVLDIETGQRGYLITRKESFLQPWLEGRKAAPGRSAELERLVADNPVQERRARAIAAQIRSYVLDYSTPLVALGRRNIVSATEEVGQGDGQRRIDGIRRAFTTFRITEGNLASSRRASADRGAQTGVLLAFGGLGATLLLLGLLALYLDRGVGVPVRRLAAAARSIAGGDLEVRVDRGGAAEIGALVTDFNAMGGALAEGREELEGQNAELAAQQAELEAQQSELEDALWRLGVEKEHLATYYGFSRRLVVESEVPAVVDVALDSICDLAHADVAVLYSVAEPGGTSFVLTATRALDPADLPGTLGEHGVAARAAAGQRTLAVSYGRTGLKLSAFGREVALSHELHVPLVSTSGTLGVLTLGRTADQPFTEEEIEHVELLVTRAAIGLSQALVLATARRQAAINGAILNATADGIVLFGSSGLFVFANDAAQRMSAIHGTMLEDGIAEVTAAIAQRTTDPAAYLEASAERAASPERRGVIEYELADSGRSFRTYVSPVVSDEGSHLGRIVVVHETTAEKEGERLKSELLATVSHELRTPLTGVLGFAELLLRQDTDPETRRQYLTTIHREARRLTALINDFLDLQRIEEGNFTLSLEPLDLGGLLRRSVDLFAAQSAVHELDLVLPDEPVVVTGEASRIEQVTANLLSNAIKYSPGGGRVEARIDARDGVARVSVTDAGLGIPAPQQKRIFQKFFRVDSSDTREIGGTGLGLALCREIVEAHGGSMGFESVEGRGSVFWFELPSGRRPGTSRSERVLVVEDDPAAAALMAEYLAVDGFEVEIASTGERALELALSRPPSLVCLDMALPGDVDGWQVLAELRAHAATAEVPVVICTANNGRNRAATLGASDFLTKPFGADALRNTIGRLLPAGGGGSVLVVDDEPSVRRLVMETLGGAGLEFREAADGEQALALIGKERPSAVVLDLMLPKLDGFAVLERLQDNPRTRSIPVVVLTGSSLSAAERERLSTAAVALLDKCEYSGSELRGLVERALGSRN